MADRFIIVFIKKVAPSKGYIGHDVDPRKFDTKTSARAYAVRMLREKRNYIDAFITTVGCIGERGEYYDTQFMRWSTSNESIQSATIKGKKVFFISSTFKHPATIRKIVNSDGTLSRETLEQYENRVDPGASDRWLEEIVPKR